jgi:hypothetical protein
MPPGGNVPAAASWEQEELVSALAEGSAEEREAAYERIERAVRAAASERADGDKPEAVALAVACVQPLIESVLCMPASVVGADEWQRVALLLYEMGKLDVLAVFSAMLRKDEEGTFLIIKIYMAPDSALGSMVTTEPSSWTREDAITIGTLLACNCLPADTVGWTAVVEAAGVDEQEYIAPFLAENPFVVTGHRVPDPVDRFCPLAMLCLDLVQSQTDEQPEGVIAGAWRALGLMCAANPFVARVVWEADFVDVMQASLQRFNPMERISKSNLTSTAILCGGNDVVDALRRDAAFDVTQSLLDAGIVDTAISTLTAYQLLGAPADASVCAVAYTLTMVERLNLCSPEAAPVVVKLRSAGVDCFRYVLDHPLVFAASMGFDTAVNATNIAALVILTLH